MSEGTAQRRVGLAQGPGVQRAWPCTEPQNLDTFYISFDARYSTGLMPVLRQIRS
ncbi:hypothetical protein SAMN05518863_1081, partial [Candidatus Pantoea symbiotica]